MGVCQEKTEVRVRDQGQGIIREKTRSRGEEAWSIRNTYSTYCLVSPLRAGAAIVETEDDMTLYLTEANVTELLTMNEAVEALDSAFKRQAEGLVINQPRRRLHMPNGTFHSMAAADLGLGTYATKVYSSFRPKTRFHVLLYSADNGDLLSIIEADRLGQVRTGAASAIATKYLTDGSNPLSVGIFGTGWQAESQLEAACNVRKVESITAYGRHVERCAAFCDKMSKQLGVPVRPASEPEKAVEGRSVVITATSSKEPVFEGEWLSPGAHVNAVGSNMLIKREIDEATIQRSSLIVVDSVEQAKLESGDLLPAFEKRLFRWEQVIELSEIVSGRHAGRTDTDRITLFKSIGIALEDTAVATLIYNKAVAAGQGKEVAGRG